MRWSKGQGDTWRVFQDGRRHGTGSVSCVLKKQKGHPLCLGEKGKRRL